MGKPTLYAETLRRAAIAVGGEHRLARALRVPLDQLQRWTAGEEYPPTPVYQKVLDLLIGIGAHP
jgi:hypothetical protein